MIGLGKYQHRRTREVGGPLGTARPSDPTYFQYGIERFFVDASINPPR